VNGKISRTRPRPKLSARMTAFWLIVILAAALFLAGLYADRQSFEAERPTAETSTEGGVTTSSPGLAGAIAGFGLLGGWMVVGGVMIYRAQKAKKAAAQ